MRSLAALALAALVVPGCSDTKDRARAEPAREPSRERRVIEPPAGIVRPFPPYGIRADGVGPYKLGERLSDLLQTLPSGPRIVVFEIPGLVHRSLIRADDGQVLIGGEPGGLATTVSVVGAEVARTESGIHVGSSKDEVLRALGPLVGDIERVRDPRVLAPSSLPNARILLEQDRVAAIVVTADGATPAPPRLQPARDGGLEESCPRPASTEIAFGTCLTGTGELVEIANNEIAVRAPAGDKTLVSFRVSGEILFAAPLRAPDGRDELVIVTHAEEPQLRQWSLQAFRIEGGKAIKSVDPTPLYQLSSANARWIGAELDQVDLYLELTSRSDAIEVGGLLTTDPEHGARDVAVISPLSVPRRHGKSAPADGGDAGVAGVGDSGAGSDSTGAARSKP